MPVKITPPLSACFFTSRIASIRPIGVLSANVRVLSYGYGVGWAEGYASLAVDTVLFFTADYVGFLIVEMGIVGALINANFTAYTTLLVSFN